MSCPCARQVTGSSRAGTPPARLRRSAISVCTTWLTQGNHYYLLDALRERLTYPDLKRRVVDQALRFNAHTIVIEDKGSGMSLIQNLESENVAGVPNPIAFTSRRWESIADLAKTAEDISNYIGDSDSPQATIIRDEVTRLPS
jgi:phage terminase large subunit-like protein